jgi:hypothetical protein
LPGARWIVPELWPICSPWLLCPANVVVILEAAIVHNSDLVGVGWSERCADRQLLGRVRLSRRGWLGWHSSWAAGYSTGRLAGFPHLHKRVAPLVSAAAAYALKSRKPV